MGSGRKANILLVDDQASNLLALEAILEDLGQNLVRATSGEEALRRLLDDDFAVILMDVKMPDLDGIDTAALIRERERSAHTPIIFLTAFERSEVEVFKGYRLGAVDYLFKPPQPEVLRSKVAVFVELYLKTEQVREQAEQLRQSERQRWEMERLREEAAREKKIADTLKEIDRRKDEFLAMLAHELRNPLAPLLNAAHLVQASNSPETLAAAGEIIERQVRHMARLIDDLLDVSRINSGKIQLRKERVILTDVVKRAVESVDPLMRARRHELTVSLPPEPVRLNADPTRLEQVLSNLLNNAAKYTPEGGHIVLEVAPPTLAEVVLVVRDDGVGIPENMLERIFDLFAQLGRSLNSTSQWGLGIGLALVRTLVGMHGGSVRAFSEGPGKGSRFVVRLPLTDKVSLKPEAPAHGSESAALNGAAEPGESLRVLVVDDSRDAAETLALLLRGLGHEVHTAYDGPSALEAAREQRPDVVLLDIGLPHMDGYEVATQLRQQPDTRAVLLVAMTGFGQEQDRQRSLAAGFDHHLVKPVDPVELQKLLARREAPTSAPR
jgi:signal transduction histidine kinase